MPTILQRTTTATSTPALLKNGDGILIGVAMAFFVSVVGLVLGQEWGQQRWREWEKAERDFIEKLGLLPEDPA